MGLTLDEYLFETRETNERFARRVGLSRQTIGALRRGDSQPTYDTVRRIFLASDGAVTPEVWFPVEIWRQKLKAHGNPYPLRTRHEGR